MYIFEQFLRRSFAIHEIIKHFMELCGQWLQITKDLNMLQYFCKQNNLQNYNSILLFQSRILEFWKNDVKSIEL